MRTKIAGVSYSIAWVEDSKKVPHEEEDLSLYGEIHYTKGSIRIWSEMPEEKQRRVLMHEIIHGVVEGYKIRELRINGGRDGHVEEAIDQLATGICEALEAMGIQIPTHKDQPTGRRK